MKGLYTNIQSNRIKTFLLVISMPIIVFLSFWLFLFYIQYRNFSSNISLYKEMENVYNQEGVNIYSEDGTFIGDKNKVKDINERMFYNVLVDDENNEKTITNKDVVDRYAQFSLKEKKDFISMNKWKESYNISFKNTSELFIFIGPLIFIYGIYIFFGYRQIIFSFTGAKPISRKENPKIYNIVENLCISRGLPVPKLGIMNDSSLNAFTTGFSPNNCWIVFSKGILEKLNKEEIEAVAGHELTHIINRDVLLMTVSIAFVSAVYLTGNFLFRIGINSKGSNKKDKGNILPFIGLGLMIIGGIVLPLVRLAISRKREYLADAGSVELTKNNKAMISALQKISGDPVIEKITKPLIGDSCIYSPFKKKKFYNIFSTHPSIKDRIKALESY